jgi:hypothetical protein
MAAGLAVDRFASQSVIGGATLSMFVSYGGRRDYFVLFTRDSILGVLIVLLSMGPLETARRVVQLVRWIRRARNGLE